LLRPAKVIVEPATLRITA